MRRYLPLAISTTMLAGLLSLGVGTHSGAAPPGPTLRPITLPGLTAAATISRDGHGIAHIAAASERDMFFLNGWLHASDRLFQMDLTRRQPSGTAAELLGVQALPGDIQARTIGLRRAAERSLTVLSAESRAALHAYADGVNAWVSAHPKLTPEYEELRLTEFEPWTPLDSVVIAKAIAFSLSFDLDVDATLAYLNYVGAGAVGGFDGDALFFQDTWRSQPFTPAATVPDASAAPVGTGERTRGRGFAGQARVETLPPSAVKLARAWRAQLKEAHPFLADRLDPNNRPGSNEWGIAGSLSATGRPMIANDPHLSLGAPSTFYPVHLTAGAYDVAGSAFAGVPGVVLGHNRHVMWGATTNPMDVTDTYLERVVPDAASPSGLSIVHRGHQEPILAVPETFRVNTRGQGVVPVPPGGGVPAATLIVPRRNNGPIVQIDQQAGLALSVQYTGFSATREIDAILGFNRARNLDDFQQALQFFDFGSQNWAYADDGDNLAYFTSAEMPLREDLEDGRVDGTPPWFIRNGQGGNEWLPARTMQPGQAVPYEILPPEEMPHVINPPAGFFVNANNDPAGTTLDNDPLNQLRPTGGIYYLNPGYDGFRGGRITELIQLAIADSRRLTLTDLQEQQADVVMIDAQVLVPYLLDAFDRATGSTTPELAEISGDEALAEAVDRLRRWDFTTPTGIAEGYDASDVDGVRSAPTQAEIDNSVAATIYALWRSRALANTVDGTLARVGLGSQLPSANLSLTALRNLLDTFDQTGGVGASGVDFFHVPGVFDAADRRDLLLLRSLREALDRLASPAYAPAFGGSTDQDDYRWGRLHRHVFGHPLGGEWNIPPAAGLHPAVPGLPGVATDGGFGTVDASGHSARADSVNGFMFGGGPVRRFAGEARPGFPEARTSLPGGTSGQRTDPRYANLLPMWLTNESYEQLLNQPGLRELLVDTVRFVPDS